ncbi:MAG: carboxypeptidase-like regulatory domain-containing protein [Planctomycetota bacterium]|nr:carboxypeptidase-like regulatory domain-containing protein [Planctomycetota bacterium]
MVVFRAFLLTTLALGAFVLAPQLVEAQTGSISGAVTNDAGEALAGVRVKASDGSGGWGGWGNIDFSDVDGNYMIDDLEPGTYELEARRYGYETETVVVDVVDGVNTVADFTLSEPTYGSVAGIVTDTATGEAIEGARVRVVGNFGGGWGGWGGNSVLTDATGSYSLDDIRTGDRDLRVSKEGYFSQTVVVTIEDGATTAADVALDALSFGSISGTVTDGATDTPVEGAWVIVRSAGGGFFGGWSVTNTDAAGAYSFSDVITGDREVRVFSPGFFSETATVTVTDGADTVADFALGGLTYGTVTGTVTDAATGEAIEGAWVRVSAGGWTQTNRSGVYEVTDVRTGTRNVRTFAWGYYNDNQSVDVLDGETSTADFALDPR